MFNQRAVRGLGLCWHLSSEDLMGYNVIQNPDHNNIYTPVQSKVREQLGLIVTRLDHLSENVYNAAVMWGTEWEKVYRTLDDSRDDFDVSLHYMPIPFYEAVDISFRVRTSYGNTLSKFEKLKYQLAAELRLNENMEYLIDLHTLECGCEYLPRRYWWVARQLGIAIGGNDEG